MSNDYINPHMTTITESEAREVANKYKHDVNYPYMDEIYKILVNGGKNDVVYHYAIDENNVHRELAFQALKGDTRSMANYAIHDKFRINECARNIISTPIKNDSQVKDIIYWLKYIEDFEEEMVAKIIQYNSPQFALEYYNDSKKHKIEMIRIVVNGHDIYCVNSWLSKYPEDIELLMPYYKIMCSSQPELSVHLDELITYLVSNRDIINEDLMDDIFNIILKIGSLQTCAKWASYFDYKDNYKLKLVILRHNKINAFICAYNNEIKGDIDLSGFEDDEWAIREEYYESQLYNTKDFYEGLPPEYQLGVFI